MQEKVKHLHDLGKTGKEIAEEIGISYKLVFYYLGRLGVKANTTRMLWRKEFDKLYKEGLSDLEIGRQLNVSGSLVTQYRNKCKLPKNSVRKYDYELVEQLCKEGLSYPEIYEKTGIPENCASAIVSRMGYFKVNCGLSVSIDITDIQNQFLFGCILGDGTLHISKGCINPVFTVGHGLKQKEYIEYKKEILSNLNPKLTLYNAKKVDERTGKFNDQYNLRIGASPSFMEFYNAFYSTGKKIIPIELLDKYYTPFAMAIHFMDDGCGSVKSVSFCTNSFDKENLIPFIKFMKDKYNLEFTLISRNIIRLKAKSYELFKELVSPYIIESMKYKFKT